MFPNQQNFGFPNQPNFGTGAGVSGLLWMVAFLVVAVVVWRERKGNVLARFPLTNLVLRRFRVNERNDSDPALEISGRAAGLISWIFVLLRLEPEFQLVVTSTDASLQAASLSGLIHTFIPLEKIYNTTCGYRRSVFALALALFCGAGFTLTVLSAFLEGNSNTFGTDMGIAFGWLIFAGIGAVCFFFSKRIAVVLGNGDHNFGFTFKRSVIEGVSVDLPMALRAIAVINARVLAAQASPEAVNTHRPSAIPANGGQCPRCATANAPGIRFCENCGFGVA